MAQPDFSGSAMIALYPRENEARDLAIKDAQPADDLHVTLIFLGSARETLPMAEVITAVAGGVASATEPLDGTVGGVATFEEGPDGAPLVLLPDVPGLTELGTCLRDELARIGVESASEHGFNPHLTVAYGGDPASAQDRIGAPLHFDALSVVVGEDRFDYPLQSPPQTLLSGAVIEGLDGAAAEIAAVAERHAPDGGYGDTWWNETSGTVFWVHADWTGNDEHDAAEVDFRAIDGVRDFECESEAAGPTGEEWQQVYSSSALAAGADCPCAQLPSGGTMRDEDAIQELAVRALGPDRERLVVLEREMAEEALGGGIGREVRVASENFPGGDDMTAAVAEAVNASQLQWEGVLMVEGKPTDDGRMIDPGAIDWRALPLTLMAQLVTAEGHDEAVVAGRIDEIWRDENRVMGRGVFDAGENGAEVARLVAERMLRGVSVDLAIRSFEYRPLNEDGSVGADLSEEQMLDAILSEAKMVYVVTDGSIGAATVCSFPAFADAEIALVASAPLRWRITTEAAMTITKAEAPASDSPSGGEAEAVVTASAAGLAPLIPPAEWFDDPALTEPTPLQVTEDGRIFGHAAVWDACHMGFEDACVLAPRSRTDYAYFLLGQVLVETDRDGENVLAQQIPCGTVTLGTGHAPLRLTRAAAVEHYDDTGTAAADVNVGEDEHGIWLAGAIRPDLSEERVRELRASKISGDWREYAGNLELIAMLAVNVPGFPIPRVRVATAGPEPMAAALVAAGVADTRVLDALRDRVADEPELAPEALALEVGLEAAAEAPAGELPRGTLAEAALLTLASAHSRTVEAVERITSAPPGDEERGKRELALLQKSLDVVERFAARGHAPAPDIHVHIPEREVTVEGPHVTVEAAPAPTVEVQNEIHVPEQPAPHVTVAAAPPAPPTTIVVEAPKPRSVRVEEDPETGARRYVPE